MHVAPPYPNWRSDEHSLTYWPLGDVAVIFEISNFQTPTGDKYLKHFLWNCPQLPQNLTDDKVNIGSGNGLVPSGNKPLPEQMLNQI